jgi:hypothetical protein
MDHPRRKSVAAIQDVQRLPRPTETGNEGSEVMDKIELASELERIAADQGRKHATDTLRQAAAALRESEWRPIESAPKGELLIYWPAVEGRNAKIPMIRVDHANSTPFRKPSHWMPLPPPPEEAK